MSKLDDIELELENYTFHRGGVLTGKLCESGKQQIKALLFDLVRESRNEVHNDEKAIFVLIEKVERL